MKQFISALVAIVAAFGVATAGAQDKKTRISIGTGGTGGVYYPLGGGIAALVSKYVPGVDATAEVTAGSIANLNLIAGGKSEMAFTMADSAWDAVNGLAKFEGKRVPLRTLAVFYPNRMHVVTVEATGINSMKDLKGKRVSTGAPVSGTEEMASRLLEASGLELKDITRERLSVAESVAALKDRKIDAFFWVGGVPTPSITDLASTPGMKVKLIDHGDAADNMRKKYGPIYVKNQILANAYPGEARTTTNVDVWNLLVVPEKADDKLVYDIVKTMFEKKDELVKVHKDAAFLDLANQASGASPIPFHPGAVRYFKERGVNVN
ncbi:MAG TPA: TAXI family TRAP transporter solute-binding subunit [Usitatibacter sp.]|nr:TAXI family TRAP transporter solute-binding subunit [Usitatibacter sp.]